MPAVMKMKTAPICFFFYIALLVFGFQVTDNNGFSLNFNKSETSLENLEGENFLSHTIQSFVQEEDITLIAEIAEEDWKEYFKSTRKDQLKNTFKGFCSRLLRLSSSNNSSYLSRAKHASSLASCSPPIYLRFEVFRL